LIIQPRSTWVRPGPKQHIRRNPRKISLTIFFPGKPGLAGYTAAKDDGSGGDNCSYKTCKAPVKLSSPTNQHPTFYRPEALLSPNQQCQSTEWKEKTHGESWSNSFTGQMPFPGANQRCHSSSDSKCQHRKANVAIKNIQHSWGKHFV